MSWWRGGSTVASGCIDCGRNLNADDHFHTVGTPASDICCACAQKRGARCSNALQVAVEAALDRGGGKALLLRGDMPDG
jgi:hypothetical protein